MSPLQFSGRLVSVRATRHAPGAASSARRRSDARAV